MNRQDAEDRHHVGVDRIMWGSDFPHDEGTYPHTTEALAHTFCGIDPIEVEKMLATNAADAYGFDLDALTPVAERIGPKITTVAAGIDHVPETTSFAFSPRTATIA